MISLNLKKRIYTSIALFFLIILVLYYKFILAYTLIVLGVYAIIEFTNISKRIFINSCIFLSNVFASFL